MIYQTVTEQDFIRAFDDANRSENFSPMARRVLFEYLDDLSDSIGEDIELDPIAICCEWAEYTETEIVEQFGRMTGKGPRVVEHRVNLNERGEFSATFWEHSYNGDEVELASYREDVLQEFVEGNGERADDYPELLNYLTGIATIDVEVCETTSDAESAAEIEHAARLESILEEMGDNGTLLIVDHIGEDSTYLFSE